MTALPSTTNVVVVGAGPTGLALACVLAAARVPFLLVDRLAQSASTSRAAVVHARTLEVLEALEVTAPLLAAGILVPRFSMRDRDTTLATLHFDRLPTRHPYTLMVSQETTEAILLERLRALGRDVHRPFTLTGVLQDADGVSVTMSDGSGDDHTVRAQYIVGADGMHSTVREHAGIAFAGDRYETSFVLADVHMSWPHSADEVMLFLAPEGLVVVAPLPGGRHRIVATMDDAPEHPSVADVQRVLDTRGPVTQPAQVHGVVWGSRFRVHHRLAEHYRAGRLLLAGDAAHVHSPAGGQGMNTGIQDGIALGHALTAVVTGQAPESRLDDYERERRPVAERVVALTDRLTRIATLRSGRSRALRNAALGVAGRIPAVGRALATRLAGLQAQ